MLLALVLLAMGAATVVFGVQHARRGPPQRRLTAALPTAAALAAQGLRRADADADAASADAASADAVYVDAVLPDVELRIIDAFVIDARMPAFAERRLLRCRVLPRPVVGLAVDERDDQYAVHTDDPRRAALLADAALAAVLTRRVRRVHTDVHEILVDERGLWLRFGRGGGTPEVELRRALDVVREVAAALAAAVQRLPAAPPPAVPRQHDDDDDDARRVVPQTTAGRDGSSVAIPALGEIRRRRE